MHILTATNHTVTLVTSASGDIDYVTSYVDLTVSSITPGSSQGTITTATTTTIVAAPAASTQRQIKWITITNSAALANVVQVFKVVGGTSYALSQPITLASNESISLVDSGQIRGDNGEFLVVTGDILTLDGNITLTGNDGANLIIGNGGTLGTAAYTNATAYVAANGAITGATKTKITYDAKGLVTSGADATTADIADSSNKRYVTDAQLVVIGNTSGTNTGDETTSTIKTKLGAASASTDGYLTSTGWNTFNGKESVITFSDGVTRTVNTVKNDLITGKVGGQTIIGGSGVTDAITYNGTTGNGTSTAGAHIFVCGNNGATESFRVLNSGSVVIGATSTTYKFDVAGTVRVGNGTASTSTTTGDLVVQSGVGIGGALNVGGAGYFAGNVGLGTSSPTTKLEIAKNTMLYNAEASAGLAIANATTPAKRLVFGYDTNIDASYLQSIQTLVSSKPLLLNPAGGNVGIGTTAPVGNLEVSGTAVGSGVTSYITNTDTTNALSNSSLNFKVGSTVKASITSTLGAGTTPYLSFANNGSERMRIDSFGNVGIGTTAPTNILSFGGNTARTIWMERHTTANTAGNNLTLQAGGATSGATDKNGGNAIISSGTSTGTGVGRIYLQTAAPSTTGTADNVPTTKVTVLGNGNVGIGTTTPSQRLEVVGTPVVNGNQGIRLSGFGNTISDKLSVGFSDVDSRVNNFAQIGAYLTDATSAGIGNIYFATRTGSSDDAPTERMTITSAGNVGIGTTAPTNILSFGGNSARTVWMERHTTANTAGNSLTLQAGGATSGATDKSGGMITMAPGLSTGTGFGSSRIQGLTRAASTGTTDNALVDRIIVPSEFNLTSGAAGSLFEVALPTLIGSGGIIEFSIFATDGTNVQVYSGHVTYALANKGGVYTNTITEHDPVTALSTGTLTTSWAATAGTNKVTIAVTATSSLTPTTFKIRYIIKNLGGTAITQL